MIFVIYIIQTFFSKIISSVKLRPPRENGRVEANEEFDRSRVDRRSVWEFTLNRVLLASAPVGVELPFFGRCDARIIQIAGLIVMLVCIAVPAPVSAQTVTVNSLTASPATVQPGQTIVFAATMTASANASNYPVEFSFAGKNAVTHVTFQAKKQVTQKYSWTVPAGTPAGTDALQLGVYNPAWHVPALAYASTTFKISTASANTAAKPVNSQAPVIGGTAQVGKVLTSTTGTWTGASSFSYKWAGNGALIAGATASTYTPVASDAGHKLTATVTRDGGRRRGVRDERADRRNCRGRQQQCECRQQQHRHHHHQQQQQRR